MLFYGARADVELIGDFFITATLHEQLQNLLITRGNFHLIKVDHCLAICSLGLATLPILFAIAYWLLQDFRQSFAVARNWLLP